MKSWREALSPLWPEKQRVRDLPDPGGAGGGTDVELQETTEAMGREFAAATAPPYVPPLPVPLSHAVTRPEGQRGESSEVWLVNPPATLPGLGVLVAGGAAEKGSQFAINSIRIDNLTSQWIYFPEMGAWVPPFWYGRVMRYDGSRVQRVKFETPGGITALPAATTLVARVVFSEEYWDEQSGASMAGNVAPTTGGASPTGVVIFDDLSGLPAEVQTTADVLANQAGLVTDSFMFGYNGVTWDRVRLAPTAAGFVASNVGIPAAGVLIFDTNNGLYVTAQSAASLPDAYAGFALLSSAGYAWNGATFDRIRVPKIFKQVASVSINANSTAVLWTPAAAKRPRLMGWVMSAASALTGDASASFFDTATTGLFMGETGFMSGTEPPYSASYGPGGPIVALASGTIIAFSSVAVTLRGVLYGTEET